MECPQCGAENTADARQCRCGHDFPTNTLVQTQGREEQPDELASEIPIGGRPLRRCAKCGATMAMHLCENMYLNGVIPSGKRMHFRCGMCGKQIKIRSLWRLCLIFLGCPIFVLMFWALYPFKEIYYLIFVLLLAMYPLALLSEFFTRIRYPRTEIND